MRSPHPLLVDNVEGSDSSFILLHSVSTWLASSRGSGRTDNRQAAPLEARMSLCVWPFSLFQIVFALTLSELLSDFFDCVTGLEWISSSRDVLLYRVSVNFTGIRTPGRRRRRF